MFIVKEEREYQIFRVSAEVNDSFQKEHGRKIIAEADNLGDLINKFQDLNKEKLHFNPEIGNFKVTNKDDDENKTLKNRQKIGK